jgi:hypothetical protein
MMDLLKKRIKNLSRNCFIKNILHLFQFAKDERKKIPIFQAESNSELFSGYGRIFRKSEKIIFPYYIIILKELCIIAPPAPTQPEKINSPQGKNRFLFSFFHFSPFISFYFRKTVLN